MIHDAVKQLQDKESGWVTRRDAAEKLGESARAALGALRDHENDPDLDVQAKVRDELKSLRRPSEPASAAKTYSIEELVKPCEKPGQFAVQRQGAGFVVTATLKNGRTQETFVSPFERQDGEKLVRVYTRCGKISDDALRWALRTNLKIAHGALAIAKDGDTEEFVITNCFLADQVTPEEIKASIKEIAQYGDWIESKLSKLDEF